jgi:hypothetical protein
MLLFSAQGRDWVQTTYVGYKLEGFRKKYKVDLIDQVKIKKFIKTKKKKKRIFSSFRMVVFLFVENVTKISSDLAISRTRPSFSHGAKKRHRFQIRELGFECKPLSREAKSHAYLGLGCSTLYFKFSPHSR